MDPLEQKVAKYEYISHQINLIIDAIIVLASFIVLVIVLYRRRTETFILSIPFLFLWYGTLSILEYTYLLEWDHNNIPFFNTKFGTNLLGSLTNYSLVTVYWIFAF